MLSLLSEEERDIFVTLLSPTGGNCDVFCCIVEHNETTEKLFEYFYTSDKRKPVKIEGLTLYIYELIADMDDNGSCKGYGFWFRMRCRYATMYEG